MDLNFFSLFDEIPTSLLTSFKDESCTQFKKNWLVGIPHPPHSFLVLFFG